MSDCIVAQGGKLIPINDLEHDLVYLSGKVITDTVVYQGISYVQTYTYTGDDLTNISQWVPQ